MYVFIARDNTPSFYFWAEHVGFTGCDWEAVHFLGNFYKKESEIILYILFYLQIRSMSLFNFRYSSLKRERIQTSDNL